MISKKKNFLKIINTINNKTRLDKILPQLISKYSRSYFKNLIKNGYIKVNNKIEIFPKKKFFKGDVIEIKFILNKKKYTPEKIFLNIVYEDSEIIVINKHNNIVVHPGSGNFSGTILNALLYHCPLLDKIPRAGIIHRLDKNTTGLMIIAKSINSYNFLVNLLKSHNIIREYEALVYGYIFSDGKVNEPIMRNKKKRTTMMVHPKGKESITHYKVIKNFNKYFTHLKIKLETGRTHQIRVHMSYINNPIVGDKIYKKNINKHKFFNKKIKKKILKLNRQALHAKNIEFIHPIFKKKIKFNTSLPDDILSLLKYIKNI